MKKTFKTGHEKIQEICEVLRVETITPAKEEAQKIITEAQERAEDIINEARLTTEKMIADARRAIEQERNVFQSSLVQASKQGLESLRQDIEKKLFNEELHEMVSKQMSDPKIIANLITAIVHAIEKEGLGADITALVPATVPAKEVNQLLAANILEKLKGKTVVLGNFPGGAKIRLEGKRLTFDISNAEIEELLSRYLRKDFRKLFFAT